MNFTDYAPPSPAGALRWWPLLWLALLAAALLCPPAIFADSSAPTADDPAEVALRLQQTYDATSSFRADFRQRTVVPMSRRQRAGEGSVIFKKPHLMRWEYEKPERQVLVGDGEQVKMYFAGSNQMMVQEVEDYLESDITYAFFSGSGDLLRDFEVKEVPDREALAEPGYQLRLLPREPHPQVEHLDLLVEPESYLIRRLKIVDHFGSVTTLIFRNIELDPELAADFYRFEPPAGTEILGR
ncbi:MAG: outer membrane lipoprotein carrier protein LolA [Desulfurivibrio sp.]|nr:outer membrane lipoprotein carrier protein LolA [Desulfurivibrio sp.]